MTVKIPYEMSTTKWAIVNYIDSAFVNNKSYNKAYSPILAIFIIIGTTLGYKFKTVTYIALAMLFITYLYT